MEHKYVSSLAQPGEAVGVLASQSVGEPATQMTLNTFHLAGRGEMNVTLGIPRLQEILTSASENIKTPFMTCPLRPNKSMEDAICIADKLKKITVADIIEHLDVSFIHAADCDDSTIYKLKMKLYKPNHYPKYTDVTLEDWERTLRVVFVRELEDAIQKHMILLSKIRGVTNFAAHPKSHSSNDDLEDADDNGSESERKGQTNEDDNDGGGGEDTEGCEDLGLEAHKRKQQGTDEVDYEDDLEEETDDDGELSDEFEKKGDKNDSDIEVNDDDDKNVTLDANNSQGLEKEKHSKPKSIGGKDSLETEEIKYKAPRRDYDRSFFVNFEGMHFEIHFKFTRQPHILLGQIAKTAAKKVCIKNLGKVGECKAITCKESGVIYYGEDGSKREEDIPSSVKEKIPALQTTGVHVESFWGMQDDLDVRYIYSNNVHAMLMTFGVEAARETIVRETQNVFKSYGISINIRHLTLVADFMTHTGGYRPMSRMGGVAESTSPFLKMCFETASKFIVEAAYHGQIDNLETPSSRICLGLPVKMGTGCMDLIQSH